VKKKTKRETQTKPKTIFLNSLSLQNRQHKCERISIGPEWDINISCRPNIHANQKNQKSQKKVNDVMRKKEIHPPG
jgi:hypothetical protein